MPSKNDRFSTYSSTSFSSSSSSSQLSTPRAFQNGFLQNLASPRLSSLAISSEEELTREIKELETDILQLERYLLSLYRTSFGDHLPELFLLDDSSNSKPYPTNFHNDLNLDLSEKGKIKTPESHPHPSLADLLGLNTPNKLSEELVRLICVICFRLSDKGHNSRLVKNSKFEDMNEECAQELGVVIRKLFLDEDNLKSVETMFQNFRSLVRKLEKVDPARMAREEKLAFWINIHNALVMHGCIVYGMCEGTTSTINKPTDE